MKQENKINIAELLKDCPKGMELYSPLCGKCLFDHLNMGTIICKKQNTQEITFTSEGYYMLPVFDNCECMIFPSKDQRDWNKFQRPFKDGDILATDLGSVFFLNMRHNTDEYYGCYVGIGGDSSFHICVPFAYKECCGLATDEEKQKLFDAIKANGYKWNFETKTLEKLIEPKLKVGDRIKYINGKNKNGVKEGIILSITNDTYDVAVTNDMGIFVPISEQDNWELAPNKFDITTLKPFDKVLVRCSSLEKWHIDFFEVFNGKNKYSFTCLHNNRYNECIPYKGNEHLLGTTNDCDEYYKTWE